MARSADGVSALCRGAGNAGEDGLMRAMNKEEFGYQDW
jgi:hypothetical protein